jgi:5-methylcytosine-specific restriction endonuclease McrBC regulatory subunit McrC
MEIPMKPFKIKDNAQEKKDSFADIEALTRRIADKTLGQLEREGVFVFPEFIGNSKDLTRDQIILQSVDDSYRSGNVMGFLGCGDERLIIESRFSSEEEDYFSEYLLNRVLDFPNIVDLKSDADQNNRLFNFLLFLFPYYLKTAMRKGLFKRYVRNRYNDGNVKGRIDIARHIKQNTPFIGNVAYSQREFSYDNSLTELVRHTIEFIKRKPYGGHLLVKVKDEVKLVVEATPTYELCDRQRVIEANKKSAIRHAYFREYRALQRLCLLILQHQKHQIGSGSRQIYGILFDGAWLWEEYVNSLIGDAFYHPMNKRSKGAQWLFARNNGGNIGQIYPDFISRNNESRIIADAKYKPIGNIGNRDYLQVLAYMFRFDAKAGYYLYPEANGTDDVLLRMNKGSTYEANVTARDDVSVTEHGLKIPADAQNYDAFVQQMRVNENEFLRAFE